MEKLKPVIIGIAGGSASGKTTVTSKIIDSVDQPVTLIRYDDYYKDQSHMVMEERVKTNYDHPFAFDTDLLLCHLKEILDGKTVQKPTYDFKNHTRSNVTECIYPTPIVILEGIFALENFDILDLIDIKIYVDTDSDIRFIRRMLRDTEERGRTIDSVVDQYLTTVRPMHEQFVEPTKRHADIIIPEGGNNTVAIDLLKTKINSILLEHNII
jgi:uridine kinase